MRYLNQLVENIDMVTVESEMNTQCEIAEALYKESVMWNYFQKSMMYQEGAETPSNDTQTSGNDNKITTASDAWKATLGNKDEHIVFRIIAFLPRFIVNFARWIGNSITKLFNNKKTKEDVETIKASNPTEEEEQEVVNMLENKVPAEKSEPAEEPELAEKKNDNVMNDILNSAIDGIRKYITANNQGEKIELTPSSVMHKVFNEKLLPTISTVGSAAIEKIVPDVKNAISKIDDMSSIVIKSVTEQTTTAYNRLNCADFSKMLDSILGNFKKSIAEIKNTRWVSQENVENIPEADANGLMSRVFKDLHSQLLKTGESLSEAYNKYTKKVGKSTNGAGNIPNKILENEDVQKMLSASMNFITKTKSMIQPFMAKFQTNQNVIHCFAVVADFVFDKLKTSKEKKINRGIKMGYDQAMAGKEMTMVDGSKKKPKLFSRMFNRNKNDNQT